MLVVEARSLDRDKFLYVALVEFPSFVAENKILIQNAHVLQRQQQQ